jgi:hypothetical protein
VGLLSTTIFRYMRLAICPLDDVSGVNSYRFATEVQTTAGDATDLYFQLFDASKNLTQHGFNPGGLRYCPAALATLQVTFKNIDTSKQFARFASQPFTQDPSIWKVSVLATDPVSGTVSMKFVLTEGTATKTCSLNANFLCSAPPMVGNPTPSFGV